MRRKKVRFLWIGSHFAARIELRTKTTPARLDQHPQFSRFEESTFDEIRPKISRELQSILPTSKHI